MDAIWNELLHQSDTLGLQVKRDVIQNVPFITSDPGHVSTEKPRGEMARTRRSRDGTWAKKGLNSYDREHQLIRAQVTTTASVPDSRVDRVQSMASMDKTMHRTVRGHPLSIKKNEETEQSGGYDRWWNSLCCHQTAIPRRPCSVTTMPQASLQNLFACFDYNLAQLRTIHQRAPRRAVALEIWKKPLRMRKKLRKLTGKT